MLINGIEFRRITPKHPRIYKRRVSCVIITRIFDYFAQQPVYSQFESLFIRNMTNNEIKLYQSRIQVRELLILTNS